MHNHSLFEIAKQCLDCTDPDTKVRLTHFYFRQWRDGLVDFVPGGTPAPLPVPGKPELPQLVPPSRVARRSVNTEKGHKALMHAICHIEFNAINLAWDAVYRFRNMPEEYYGDWLQVADEEAYHFALLRERLNQLGGDYGDFNAHNGLWEMACKTDHDVMTRMALVPRVLEARGLDVTPGIMNRLRNAGDLRTVSLLEIILRDEVGHVEIGTRWFRYLCKQRELDPVQTFEQLLDEYMKGHVKGPFHEEARIKAGFSEPELVMLRKKAGNHE
ncbi:MAG TPA: ferritin-like domain-containing protein [Gammaproteobacteria bacterium]|nr:ferritin-like domain-containing protein [Gammaproteobacteria bacterium]